jgi:hypothetical protein
MSMDKSKTEKRKLVRLLLQLILWIGSFVLCFVWYDWKLAVIIFTLLWANNMMLWETKILPLDKMIQLIFKSISFENGESEKTKT